jgi:2-C-methyl-D-erythritol 2,4-cyclodiphosphate synthase
MRIGQGFDAHAFAEGRRLVLGGVEIPHPRGLAGYSDGDALLHAIIDALLGAAAQGDIGTAFPSSDDRWRDADSIELLRIAAGTVREAGYSVSNLDATIIAEAPRLAPHVAEICARIAGVLEIDINQVSVKPKTADGLGFTGREEGIAAFATVLLE